MADPSREDTTETSSGSGTSQLSFCHTQLLKAYEEVRKTLFLPENTSGYGSGDPSTRSEASSVSHLKSEIGELKTQPEALRFSHSGYQRFTIGVTDNSFAFFDVMLCIFSVDIYDDVQFLKREKSVTPIEGTIKGDLEKLQECLNQQMVSFRSEKQVAELFEDVWSRIFTENGMKCLSSSDLRLWVQNMPRE